MRTQPRHVGTMLEPGYDDMTAQRWADFTDSTDFPGYDFSNAAIAMQVRASKDRSDTPLISLTGGSGITVSVATANGVPTSTVTINITKATISDLGMSNPAGGDMTFYYDMTITPFQGLTERWLEGAFIVRAGVTHG